MTETLILRFIQIFIIGLIIWIGTTILTYTGRHQISLKERFWTGFGIGFITDLLDTLGIGTREFDSLKPPKVSQTLM